MAIKHEKVTDLGLSEGGPVMISEVGDLAQSPRNYRVLGAAEIAIKVVHNKVQVVWYCKQGCFVAVHKVFTEKYHVAILFHTHVAQPGRLTALIEYLTVLIYRRLYAKTIGARVSILKSVFSCYLTPCKLILR